MNYWQLFPCLLVASSLALAEDELPLPVFGVLPQQHVENPGLLKPSAVIRPPGSTPITVAPSMTRPTLVIRPPTTAGPIVAGAAALPEVAPAAPVRAKSPREIALAEIDRRNQERVIRQQIAEAHVNGSTTELRQVIVMSGPVDTAVGRSPTPPTTAVDGGKVALIGIAANDMVTKNLEPFFGTPMTPDSEQRLIETVKSQMASKGMDVRIAGWWPKEGVMAVSVMPKGS